MTVLWWVPIHAPPEASYAFLPSLHAIQELWSFFLHLLPACCERQCPIWPIIHQPWMGQFGWFPSHPITIMYAEIVSQKNECLPSFLQWNHDPKDSPRRSISLSQTLNPLQSQVESPEFWAKPSWWVSLHCRWIRNHPTLRWVVPVHLQSSSSLSFSATKPSCGIMLGWPAAENVVRKIKWHLKQSSVMQALNNSSYRDCYGTCDFCSYNYNCIDNSAYQYLAMAQNISKFFKPLLFTSGIAGQWMFMPGRMFASFPPRGSPPKLLPSAAALLRADVWLPRVLWRLPAGRVWQHGSKFQIWTIRLDRCLVAFLYFLCIFGDQKQIHWSTLHQIFGIFNFGVSAFNPYHPLSAFMDRLGLLVFERLIYGVKLRLMKSSFLIADHILI